MSEELQTQVSVSFKSFDEKAKEQNKKIEDFSSLIGTIISAEDKKKILWAQIYEHAIEDRTHSYMLFTDLYMACQGKAAEHQVNGPVLAKYIERMSRANDQILKLAELIQNSQSKEEQISEDDIFNKIKEDTK